MAAAVGLAAGIFTFTVFVGATGSAAAALAAAVAGAVAAALALVRLFPVDERAASPGLKIVSAAAAFLALAQLGRVAVFMVDPAQAGYASLPSSAWETRHSCLTAYFVAAEAAGRGGDVYDAALYTAPDDDPARIRKARMMGRFGIDVYEYPPPFLVLPRAVRLLTADFFRTRPLWFGLNGAVVLLGMLVVARQLGPEAGTRAMLFAPLVWAGLPMTSVLQKGNVQALVVAAAMIGMALFARRRFAAGGALLAYATVSKLFPGMLVAYLLFRRQWRALAWTTAMAAACALVALADLGWQPYVGFLGHLPGLLSGEAFPAFRNPAAMAINYSIPGLVFKAGLFGVPGMGFGASKVVGWIFTVVVLWAVVRAARRPPSETEAPLVWLALLVLATLRSPFLPQAYAALPPLWLLTLLAATRRPTTSTVAAAVGGWLVFNVFWPLDWPVDPRVLAAANAVPQALTVAVAVLALRRRAESVASDRDGVPVFAPAAVARA